jgi:hypothetical protein
VRGLAFNRCYPSKAATGNLAHIKPDGSAEPPLLRNQTSPPGLRRVIAPKAPPHNAAPLSRMHQNIGPRLNVSKALLVSLRTRSGASETKTTHRPSRETTAFELSPLAWAPVEETLARIV